MDITHPLGIPHIVVSDNAQCFTTVMMKEFTGHEGIEWKKVWASVPMSNGWAERMVQSVKSSVEKISRYHEEDLDKNIGRVVYGYHLMPLSSVFSPFELLYGVPPRIVQDYGD